MKAASGRRPERGAGPMLFHAPLAGLRGALWFRRPLFLVARMTIQFSNTDAGSLSAPTARRIYVVVDGRRLGPLTVNQLASNGAQATSWVWFPGLNTWRQIQEVPELLRIVDGASPTAATLSSLAGAARRSPGPLARWFGRCRPAISRRRLLLVSVAAIAVAAAAVAMQSKGPPKLASGGGASTVESTSAAPVDFPLSWKRLLQMTGDGPDTKKFFDAKGNLLRVEAKSGIQVLVAVEAVGKGFAIAVANGFAVADFTTRPWFNYQEQQALQTVYAEFVTDRRGAAEHKAVLPRFVVTMRRDREISSYACFELQPRN